ncbi:MAG: hypothetical protein V1757_04040 [Actinomycetota bacterium]
MTTLRRLREEDGFTIVEAMVAVTILAVGISLTIQPVMASLRRISDARTISVAENLAQAEIESLRALAYEDVGLPGRTPSGVLDESHEVNVEGRLYVVEVDVRYAGSLTGLDVIPQGGDGVEGSWDPGVDYKVVKVTVTAEGRESDPVVMETIVSPRSVGTHEGIANARVYLAAYEPFAPSEYDLPSLKIQASPAAPIASALYADQQVFPAIPPADYTVTLDDADGWIIHPADIVAGQDRLHVTAGTLAETTLRVYRPATLQLTVVDYDTGAAVTAPRLAYTNLVSGQTTTLASGVQIATGLIPDAYDLTVTASGYETWTLSSVNIPGNYPDPVHNLTVRMQPIVPPTTTTTTTTIASTTTTQPGTSTTTTVPGTTTTTTQPPDTRTVDFEVEDNTGRRVHGATITITASGQPTIVITTDDHGLASYNLVRGVSYTATASTAWGHGPDSDTFNPQYEDDIYLDLTRPWGKGTLVLQGGDRAEFLYRAGGEGSWTVLPANYEDEASFVANEGSFQVAKRCLANGQVLGTKTVSVSRNENRYTSISGWCP